MFFFFLMIRRPPRSTLDRSSAASDVYKRQERGGLPVILHKPDVVFFGIDPQLFQTLQIEPLDIIGGRFQDHLILVVVPVSYTHLRAHETVLDLVCRLLLEKKKEERKMDKYNTSKHYLLNKLTYCMNLQHIFNKTILISDLLCMMLTHCIILTRI